MPAERIPGLWIKAIKLGCNEENCKSAFAVPSGRRCSRWQQVIELSVIICTHNPRQEYLRRVLDALRNQSLSKDHWELLLVDNASEMCLSGECDLSWHPNGRHRLEGELGLASARR